MYTNIYGIITEDDELNCNSYLKADMHAHVGFYLLIPITS